VLTSPRAAQAASSSTPKGRTRACRGRIYTLHGPAGFKCIRVQHDQQASAAGRPGSGEIVADASRRWHVSARQSGVKVTYTTPSAIVLLHLSRRRGCGDRRGRDQHGNQHRVGLGRARHGAGRPGWIRLAQAYRDALAEFRSAKRAACCLACRGLS